MHSGPEYVWDVPDGKAVRANSGNHVSNADERHQEPSNSEKERRFALRSSCSITPLARTHTHTHTHTHLHPTAGTGSFAETHQVLDQLELVMRNTVSLVASQMQSQNCSVLATQFPKSQPCPLWQLEIAILHRKSQLDTLRFGTQLPKSHWPLSLVPLIKLQRFKSQWLQDENANASVL